MRSFDQLLGLLSNIPDPRRAEGKLYKLQHVLLFSIFAVVTGGNSYRSIVTFINVHRRRLNAAFGLHWRRAPAYTSIRDILQGLEPQAVEQMFRQHAAGLCSAITDPARRVIAIDGKTLRRSFDNFTDRKAAQVLHAFDVEASRPGTLRFRGKVQRNPRRAAVARRTQCRAQIVTLDAMHCQKKPSRPPHSFRLVHRPSEGQSALAIADSRNRLRFPAARQAAKPRSSTAAQPTRNQVGRRFQRDPLLCRNRVEGSHQIYRPRHSRGLASRCQDRPLEQAAPRSHTTWPILPYRRASPPPQSGTIGTSRIHCTTLVTSLSRKINPASVVTRASSCVCAASLTMCFAVTEPSLSQDRYAAALAGFSAPGQLVLQFRAFNSPGI